MLLHLVCFKYNTGIDAATREQHRSRLAGLKDIDGVADLKVGGDVVGSPRSYDTWLAITFRDRAALDAYQTNERHVPVAQWGASISQHVVAVDFEI